MLFKSYNVIYKVICYSVRICNLVCFNKKLGWFLFIGFVMKFLLELV